MLACQWVHDRAAADDYRPLCDLLGWVTYRVSVIPPRLRRRAPWPRCHQCGHRVRHRGRAPVETKRRPWRAPAEMLERRMAMRLGRA